MKQKIDRNYLEILSLKDLKETTNTQKNYSIELLNPTDFQLNKFFYKNIGKSHQWVDRLVWTDKNWIDYTSNKKVKTYILKDNDELAGYFELNLHKDEVEIASGCTVDRGSVGDTIIGSNTYLDNQVHVAHNVKIGKNCMIAGQVGFAGSSTLGDNVSIGGQAGISGHLKIGNNVKIGGGSGVVKDIPDDTIVMGYPAVPLKEFLKKN